MLTENKLDFGTLETRIIKCLFSFKHLNSGVGWFFTHLEMLLRTWLETELMVNSQLSGSVSLSLCLHRGLLEARDLDFWGAIDEKCLSFL